MISGSRLLKPGMDGHHAVVLDLTWPSAESPSTPDISAVTIAVADYEPDPELQAEMTRAYSGNERIHEGQFYSSLQFIFIFNAPTFELNRMKSSDSGFVFTLNILFQCQIVSSEYFELMLIHISRSLNF